MLILISEKLKFVIGEMNERLKALFKLTKILYKEESQKDGRIYYPIAVLLLNFCFMDFLRRYDYILINGKDGYENSANKKKYIKFLDKFIINNDKYKEYKYSFTAEQLYEIRCDLVHSFGLKSLYQKESFTFVGGTGVDNIIKKLKPIYKMNILKMTDFQEIIKSGIKKMLYEYKKLLLKEVGRKEEESFLLQNLNILFVELKNTPCYFIGFKNPIN